MYSISQRRWGTAAVGQGTDFVILAWGVPSESKIVNMKGEVHLVGPVVDDTDIAAYGVQGWMLDTDTPLNDFDDLQTLWDAFVPKATGSLAYDNVSTVDTAAAQEPGLVNPAQVFGQEFMGPYRFFDRLKVVTLASRPTGYNPDGGGANVDEFLPTDVFSLNVQGPLHSGKMNRGCLIGVSSPDWGETAAPVVFSPIATGTTTGSFEVLKYLEDHIHSAVIALDTMFESGAESPWIDILTWVVDEMERVNVNSGAGVFTGIQWQATAVATAQLIVPGSMKQRSIGPDSQA